MNGYAEEESSNY